MLIDTKGNIAFKGHPANRKKLEDDFETLLAGGSLTGEGTGPAAGEEGKEDEVPEGMKEDLDVNAANREIDDFKTVGEGLQKDEDVKKHAAKLQRGFCVMVL